MCLGVLFLLGSSAAQAVVLTFEGLQDLEPIDNYYNGGTGCFGSGPGPNYGVNFTSDSLAIIKSSDGGSGNFSNNPSGSTCAFFLSGVGDTMNIASGFTTGFSFFYSAVGSGSVTVWSNLNGTGTLLATLVLSDTANNGPPGGFYNHWVAAGATFAGTAESAIFSGAANFIGFDDITVGSASPGVPDSGSTVMLLGMAIAGIAALKRKLA